MKRYPDIVMQIPERPALHLPFIVAEISKNWRNGESATPLLATQFEMVIEHNRQRGYRLHSFQLHQLLLSRADHANPDNEMVETIIAVFEALDKSPATNAVDPAVQPSTS